MTLSFTSPICIVFCLLPATASFGAVVTYHSRAQWRAAVNNVYRTIDFTGYPESTLITTQYLSVGVNFTDATDYINISGSYVNDGAGLASPSFIDSHITVRFGVPQYWIGADFPGELRYMLYQGSTLIYTSGVGGSGGTGFFYGLVSDQWFDRAVLFRDGGAGCYIDDLFYNAVPAPGVLGALALVAVLPLKRRRR
jgi:hypothetical protein